MIDNSIKDNVNQFIESLPEGLPRKTIESLCEAFDTDETVQLYTTKTNGADLRIRFQDVGQSRVILTMSWQLKKQLFICKLLYPSQKVSGLGIVEVVNSPKYEPLKTTFKFDCSSLQAINDFVNLINKVVVNLRQNNKEKEFEQEEPKMPSNSNKEQPLNRILFGAAGTGKTYHTINYALSILEPNLNLDKIPRLELKEKFDYYLQRGKIRFVTFHQSFSYEDFVEGIRANTNKNGQVEYKVESGIFKELCNAAAGKSPSLVGKTFGQGYVIERETEELYEIKKPNGNIVHFSKELVNFLVASCEAKKITIEDISTKNIIEKLGNHPVLEPYIVNGYNSLLKNLISLIFDNSFINSQKIDPYVLIIDEINRGNISRIFGELITLIEDSKRAGEKEELSAILPYSKETLSVPKNLYLIGTMNSSDRSLTGLDMALRRRFTFVDMPPNPELLKQVTVDRLNIGELLEKMNHRIEVLLDRDHCIGHAYFMPLENEPTVELLAHIFQQKIIPLLQEYFFDDWAKINMVLFDNGMLQSKTIQNGLFPSNGAEELGYLEQKTLWSINTTIFSEIETYCKILG